MRHAKERWTIYFHGTDGVKALTFGLLSMWRHVPTEFRAWGKALAAVLRASVVVVWVLIGPLMFWLAPVIAIFTAHRVVPEAEVRARMRQRMHQMGTATNQNKD